MAVGVGVLVAAAGGTEVGTVFEETTEVGVGVLVGSGLAVGAGVLVAAIGGTAVGVSAGAVGAGAIVGVGVGSAVAGSGV